MLPLFQYLGAKTQHNTVCLRLLDKACKWASIGKVSATNIYKVRASLRWYCIEYRRIRLIIVDATVETQSDNSH